MLTSRSIFWFCKKKDENLYELATIKFPFFDVVKHDYTSGEWIRLTPLLSEGTGIDVMTPDDKIEVSLDIKPSQMMRTSMMDLGKKYDYLKTNQIFFDSAFLFYETLWFHNQQGIKLARTVGERLNIIEQPSLNYQ